MGSSQGRAAGDLFSSPGSTFCADSYFGIRFTSMLPQLHVKDPDHSAKSTHVLDAVARKRSSHSAKSTGERLQLNTHAPYVVAACA